MKGRWSKPAPREGETSMRYRMTLIGTMLAALACQPAFADSVKIALPVASLESMPIYIAQANGIFKKHDVDVDIITSRGGGEAMKAYISGDVRIMWTWNCSSRRHHACRSA
jgi:ABC-type nitrate/sulfonate/bicarbonate transport system substrate-binding protein